MLDDVLNRLENRANIRAAVELLPRERLKVTELIEEKKVRLTKNFGTRFVYRLDYTGSSVFAVVTVDDHSPSIYTGDFFQVVGLYLWSRTAEDLKANEFSFKTMRTGQYVVSLLFVAIPIFTTLCFFACLFSPLPWRTKAIWLVAIGIGLFQFGYSWATGVWGLNLLGLQFPVVNVIRAEPWADRIVMLGFPLAAIVFWIKYPEYIRRILSSLRLRFPRREPV